MKRKQLYLWHRWLSAVCLLPVLMWCLSGLMHPLMGHFFKISPAEMFLKQAPFETDATAVDLQDLPIDKTEIKDLRLVRVDGQPYYQIQTATGQWQYYSWADGSELVDGDQLYAKQLARYFLGDQTAGIVEIERVDEYTAEYKIINRLLPVYRVAFDRADGMEVYVHTGSSRLGTLNDRLRKGFLWVFSMFHNWDFLGENSYAKKVAVLVFSSLVFVTGVLGLVIFFSTKNATTNTSERMKPRRRHRKLAVAVSIVLLMFSFSGAYHSLQKFEPYDLNGQGPAWATIGVGQLEANPMSAIRQAGTAVRQMSLKVLNGKWYYRIVLAQANTSVVYLSVDRLMPLVNGDLAYATQRAFEIAGQDFPLLAEPELITRFYNEYGFINKRLPVVKVAFDTPDHLTCFVEPSSGIPGAIVRDKNRAEILSFIFLHKYNMFNFLGKGVRDGIMSMASLAVVMIAMSGLWILLKKN
ncbi:PepSY domain-containing protein [Reichenbachiella carrageenanivorans]|uniref:PepSY domain-containing protein n=1 Tax=Reichenbachiella carrageenanivorans TaxID=2979869 RepID=A0ABY6D0G9_9BACT|nr:PepSY domain-containing protein [Reichenbachiella carrageenanivorans]UXX79657.1 PepSY domain-containing protein [Reichenbachiella carrageenanivorans]